MFIGNVELDDGPYPGEDAIRELRTIRCAELLEQSELDANVATLSGTFPRAGDWANLGRRSVTCDATPL